MWCNPSWHPAGKNPVRRLFVCSHRTSVYCIRDWPFSFPTVVVFFPSANFPVRKWQSRAASRLASQARFRFLHFLRSRECKQTILQSVYVCAWMPERERRRERESAVRRRRKGDLFLNVGKQRHFFWRLVAEGSNLVFGLFLGRGFFLFFSFFVGMSAKYVLLQQVAWN